MPRFRSEFATPLEEVINTAGQLDDDEQLDLLNPREHIAIQEPEYIRSLGQLALQRAMQWLTVAYECRDELTEQGFFEKSRKRVVNLAEAVPELGAGDVA